jgi:hypothetical protein
MALRAPPPLCTGRRLKFPPQHANLQEDAYRHENEISGGCQLATENEKDPADDQCSEAHDGSIIPTTTSAVCHVILAGRWMVGLVSGKKSSEVLKGIIMNCCNYG